MALEAYKTQDRTFQDFAFIGETLAIICRDLGGVRTR
jgi:hypothetical protein